MGILKIKSEMEHAPDKDTHEYLNSKFNVHYVAASSKSSEKQDIFSTTWNGNLIDGKKRGSHPYYCPKGWKKYALMVPHHETAKVCFFGSLEILLALFCVW